MIVMLLNQCHRRKLSALKKIAAMRGVYAEMVHGKGKNKDPFPVDKNLTKLRSSASQARTFDSNLEFEKYTNAPCCANPTGERDTLMAYVLKTDNWINIEIEYYAAKKAADSIVL